MKNNAWDERVHGPVVLTADEPGMKRVVSPLTRRAFMKGGAMAVVGTAAIPAFLTRSVLAEVTSAQAQGKKLVVHCPQLSGQAVVQKFTTVKSVILSWFRSR